MQYRVPSTEYAGGKCSGQHSVQKQRLLKEYLISIRSYLILLLYYAFHLSDTYHF